MTSPHVPCRRPARRLPALLLAGLLAACSRENPPPPAAPDAGYAAVARGRIDVEGGLLSLGMPRDGVLAEVDVREGDQVRRGQQLAALDGAPARLAVEGAQAELEQAQAQAKLLAGKLAAARQRAQRLEAAARAGAGDGQSADDARAALAELDGQQQVARAAAAMAAQKLAAARYELAQRSLRAPIDADVVRVSAQPGAAVSPQAAVFTLLPRTPRIVRAELSEAYVGAVKPGMPAQVSAESDDGHAWGAHVLRVGQVVGPASLEDDPQLRADTRTVECVLGFDQPQALRIGQRVLVRFGSPAPPQHPAKG
ncbi:secretion protein HlyD [Frateuria sp. Soil773]|uniref:efflux RND transporter periplasmic adaptor subunit n=1 Tax=Frateuria sp. Soil773 TaxID=1736407 RepID=UPI0006F4C27D|nr:HlyD family efflux transporter periplasmic adaptor subunit [Frateuria sp. Soil773]KRE88420.1 secretion protein HlyD [Frateuria sp. Soil773]